MALALTLNVLLSILIIGIWVAFPQGTALWTVWFLYCLMNLLVLIVPLVSIVTIVILARRHGWSN